MTPTAPLSPGLYVAATPIGNLQDVSDRLKHALSVADLILCEDTRVTAKLLTALGLSSGPMRRYDDHRGASVRPAVLEALSAGQAVLLVSDAGTPLIADPGYKLVAAARADGHKVITIPGPCAAIAALSISGLPTDRFTFQGFLPPKSGARRARLSSLLGRDETLVFYETGPRLGACLEDIASTLNDPMVAIGRELTKLYEEVVEGPASMLAARYAQNAPKGEIVLIIGPQAPEIVTLEDADPMMEKALLSLSLKDAAAQVARTTGIKKRDLYQRWRNRTP
ncbi:MAG: 16S rRNA (cytidine(1402)-2'-O)-methyltransferase [Pseudomonadota bacterium]